MYILPNNTSLINLFLPFQVFSNSALVKYIETYGKGKYFPDESYHIIGDSAFALKSWLLTPYSRRPNLTRCEKYHNNKLSADRVCIENTFALIKLRWARLFYVNTYCISKAVEICTAACILHNFCYLKKDFWDEHFVQECSEDNNNIHINQRGDYEHFIGIQKRNMIAQRLWRQRTNFQH